VRKHKKKRGGGEKGRNAPDPYEVIAIKRRNEKGRVGGKGEEGNLKTGDLDSRVWIFQRRTY